MKKLLSVLALHIMLLAAYGQDHSMYEKKWLVQGGDTLPYRLLMPLHYDSTRSYPVIFFLHGAGERGSDNERQLIHGSKLFANHELRAKYPAFVIIPQCSRESYWSNVLRLYSAADRSFEFLADSPPTRYMELLMELVRYTLRSLPVQKQQVYVGGLSMGGMGTFELVRRMPKTFAAAFPICGGGHTATAKKMKKVNWWVFHGAKDDVVPPLYSERMVKALQSAGANVKFTLYPHANHNSWDPAFAEPELFPWLFSQTKKK